MRRAATKGGCLAVACLCGISALARPSALRAQASGPASAGLSLNATANWIAQALPVAGTFRHMVSRDHDDVTYGYRLTAATLRSCELRVSGKSYVVDLQRGTHQRDSVESRGIVGGTARLSTIDPEHVIAEQAPREQQERWADDLWYVTLYRSDGSGQALAIAVATQEIADQVATTIRHAVQLCGGKPARL